MGIEDQLQVGSTQKSKPLQVVNSHLATTRRFLSYAGMQVLIDHETFIILQRLYVLL